jgi:hypothetical protein
MSAAFTAQIYPFDANRQHPVSVVGSFAGATEKSKIFPSVLFFGRKEFIFVPE